MSYCGNYTENQVQDSQNLPGFISKPYARPLPSDATVALEQESPRNANYDEVQDSEYDDDRW
jgi:hypothetical protein